MNTKKVINSRDMGRASATSLVDGLPQTETRSTISDTLQTQDQLSFENPWKKFLNEVKSGNIQDQIQTLSVAYSLYNSFRRALGAREISRTQFLESTQCLLRSQGLAFDKTVLRSCQRKLRSCLHAIS